MNALYSFAPGLCLSVDGDAATVGHFDREYGAAPGPPAQPVVEVAFDGHGIDWPGDWVAGGHKSMHWRIKLGPPGDLVLRARLELAGRPRSFARTLVQGYVVEPLVSIAAARAGMVLLPAAAFRDETGAVVVMGRSGSGKTSLAMHALANGVQTLGDDQVLVGADGKCSGFPRRMRVYTDIREKSPEAYARLPRAVVAGLTARRIVRMISRGAVAPALAVDTSIFGRVRVPDPAPIRRVAVLERSYQPTELRLERATIEDAVERALTLLREQREHLVRAGGDPWRGALAEVEAEEARLLEIALAGATVDRILMPCPVAGSAMAGVARAVGISPAGS